MVEKHLESREIDNINIGNIDNGRQHRNLLADQSEEIFTRTKDEDLAPILSTLAPATQIYAS